MIHKRKYIPERDAVTYVMSRLLNAIKKVVEIKTDGIEKDKE
jgi:hypothetical protein